MCKKFLIAIVVLLLVPSMAWSVEVYRDGDRSLDIGYFGQAWYQWVEDGNVNGDKALNDFYVRRSYLSIKGSATPMLDFFLHYATDKTGKNVTAGTDNTSANSQPIVVRDGYMRAKLMGEALMVNIGRMYVPLTRTPSTKCLLTIDIDWTQGGNRGASFIPNVGGNRDDGIMVWGNLMDDMLRYRFMIADGIDNGTATKNPDDTLRYTGQVSVSLMDPEKGYFNPQTYLGKKSVLSILAGFDMQADLGAAKEDYSAWTAEVHYDQPIGDGGVTVEVGYIDISKAAQAGFGNLAAGDDATIISAKAGYIFPNQLQPLVHYEKLDIDNKDGVDIYGVGINYFVKGHANKVSLDVTKIDPEAAGADDQMVVTVQLEVGF